MQTIAQPYASSTQAIDAARTIDPRVVLAQIVLMACCAFYANDPLASIAAAAFIAASLAYFGYPKQALRLIGWMVLVNAICELIVMTPGLAAVNFFLIIFFLLRKMVPMVGIMLLFLHALTVSRLMMTLSKWHAPKALSLTLAIAYRFLPTIGQELSSIRDALKLRGRPLNLKSFIKAPREMTECVLVPLMMRCVCIADELAASATTRAVENPTPRTSRVDLRMRCRDWVYLGLVLCSAACVVGLELW